MGLEKTTILLKVLDVYRKIGKTIQRKIFNWKRSVAFAVNSVYATKLIWFAIGTPTIILNSIHIHHIFYGLALVGYSVFRRFRKNVLPKPTFTVGLVLLLDGLKDTLMFPGTTTFLF